MGNITDAKILIWGMWAMGIGSIVMLAVSLAVEYSNMTKLDDDAL